MCRPLSNRHVNPYGMGHQMCSGQLKWCIDDGHGKCASPFRYRTMQGKLGGKIDIQSLLLIIWLISFGFRIEFCMELYIYQWQSILQFIQCTKRINYTIVRAYHINEGAGLQSVHDVVPLHAYTHTRDIRYRSFNAMQCMIAFESSIYDEILCINHIDTTIQRTNETTTIIITYRITRGQCCII